MEHFNPWGREAVHDTDAAEMRAESLALNQYLSQLAASPSCRDPDHPGCAQCASPNPDHDAAAMRVMRGGL